jgi:AraC family transcriptional regulator of adaptative response/methylated-DNA-[protein]-cysteine methyltransferase
MAALELTDALWAALIARTALSEQAGGPGFYGVRSTKVFCDFGCPSPRPRRENVRLFASVAEAEAAGFRRCKRCAKRAEKAVSHSATPDQAM